MIYTNSFGRNMPVLHITKKHETWATGFFLSRSLFVVQCMSCMKVFFVGNRVYTLQTTVLSRKCSCGEGSFYFGSSTVKGSMWSQPSMIALRSSSFTETGSMKYLVNMDRPDQGILEISK